MVLIMPEEPFLILHKVRGEPAFDIAIRIGQDSDGPLWIIPTSGHRAYPFRTWNMTELEGDVGRGYWQWHLSQDHCKQLDWKNWPDHYAANDRPIRNEVKPPKAKPTINDLAELFS